MPDVVVRDLLHVAEPQRQDRLRAFERLNLTLLVDAQHQGILGRIQLEPHDIAHHLDEERIGRELERLAPMRLHAEEREVALHGALTDPRFVRHGAHAPMRRLPRSGLEHGPHQPGNLVVLVGCGAARTAGRHSPARPCA